MNSTPKFSIVMASRLADYPNAAKNRETKIIRAILSVLKQSCTSFELIVVADSCKKTIEVVEDYFYPNRDQRIRLLYLDTFNGLWSGYPRNAGIASAKGKWITYLDIDDLIGPEHLEIIEKGINACSTEPKWVYYNDWLANPKKNEDGTVQFSERTCLIDQVGMNGTGNITHLRKLPVEWEWKGDYRHDWNFIRKLYYQIPREHIPTPQYYVCHLPKIVDF